MSQEIMLSPAIKQEKENTLTAAVEITATLIVSDPASLAQAEQWLQVVLAEKDALEAMRVSATQPINASLRQINSWFRPMREKCEQIEARLKGQVARYISEQRRIADEQYAAAMTAHRAGDDESARQALTVASQTQTAAPRGVSLRESWTYCVVDPMSLPREWLIPNDRLLAAHCSGNGGLEPSPVPGVVFARTASVTMRRSR